MAAFRVMFSIDFSPSLSIAKQQKVMDSLERLGPAELDVSDTRCTLELQVEATRRERARDEAEAAVARALFDAGHTMATAPITVRGVAAVPQ
jgi:hypothetical protein